MEDSPGHSQMACGAMHKSNISNKNAKAFKKVPNSISKFNKKYTGHRDHSNLIDLENNQRRRNAEDN